MLEWIRKEAVERPKVIGALMILIGGVFVLSMGWWGFSATRNARSNVVARVDGVPIKVDDYSRDYLIMKDNYKRLLRGGSRSKDPQGPEFSRTGPEKYDLPATLD